MLLVACGLAAQAPQPVQNLASGQTPLSTQVKRLSLREALQTSLQYNLQVDIAQQARVVTDAGIPVSQGVFDWNLAATGQDQKLDTAASGPLITGGPSYKQTLQPQPHRRSQQEFRVGREPRSQLFSPLFGPAGHDLQLLQPGQPIWHHR
jgi:hypothetical protein